MFITLNVSIEVIRELRKVVAELEKGDREIAAQIRQSASSSALNVAEGSKRRGKDAAHFYRIAAGSCAETRANLQVACAWGHLDALDLTTVEALLDRQAALMYRLNHRR
jgi:four helix bundle protein